MRHAWVLALLPLWGCATVVEGHERALYYSAREGLSPEPVPSGLYWHLPWNGYLKYDLRWTSHKEEIHIHSKDGLHMNIDVVVVIRPNPGEIYPLDVDVGPEFYEEVVKPSVYAATRDASGRFNHLEIATQTHAVEEAIRLALVDHLAGKHLEVSEVAIQHFDLPDVVEQAANRTAASGQLLAAREVDLQLAQRDAAIEQTKRKGVVESEGIERKMRSQQELDQANFQAQIEESKRRSERARVEAEVDAQKLRSEAEAQSIRVKASAEKERLQGQSAYLTPAYVKLQGLEALAKAMSGPNTKVMVVPVGKNGLPAYFTPFLEPYGVPGEAGGK